MSAPFSNVIETDLSFKIVGNSGVGCGLIIPDAARGPVGSTVLVTSQTQFLDTFTPNSSIEVGYDNAYYSALAYLEMGNTLYVTRVVDTASTFYAGTLFNAAAAPVTGAVTVATATTITLPAAQAIVGNVVSITAGPGLNDSRVITAVSGVIATVGAWTTTPTIASTYAVYSPAVALTPTSNVVDPTAVALGVSPVFFTAKNQGSWGNGIYIKTLPYFTAADPANPQPGVEDPLNVGEPGAFAVEVYMASNLQVPVESFTVSRDIAHKNGRGKNIYVNTALDASAYINGYNNVAVANTINPSYTPTPIQLAGGVDGVAATNAQMVTAVDLFTNVITVPIRIFMDGGRAVASYQKALIALCEQRNDCVALLSLPFATEQSSTKMTGISTYRRTTLNANTSFAAMYTSWVYIADRFNDRSLYVSPDGYAAASIAKAARKGEIWDAPAGVTRGLINVLSVAVQYTQGEMDTLYDMQINPILQTLGSGIMIWGQKTLQSRASDTDRLNVRLMLAQIEPAIKEYMRGFVFDINDQQTRTLASLGLESFMSDIKARGGVFDYKIVIDTSNNTPAVISANKMAVAVYIKASLAAEFITSNVIIVSRGTSFTTAAALV